MEITFDGSSLSRPLNRVLRRLKDGTELATLMGEEYTQGVDERFKSEVDPDGSPWAALDPDYVAWKRRRGFIQKTLQMRGNMRARVGYKPYPDRVTIGTDTPYARRQNAKRPFLYRADGSIGAKDNARIERVAENYLQSLLDG